PECPAAQAWAGAGPRISRTISVSRAKACALLSSPTSSRESGSSCPNHSETDSMNSHFNLACSLTPFLLLAAGCGGVTPDDGGDEALERRDDALGVSGWSANAKLPMKSYFPPSAATLYNDVYMVHGGGDCGFCNTLYWSKFNGSTWSADTKIPNQ